MPAAWLSLVVGVSLSSVSWQAPPECPRVEAVEASVSRLLGERPLPFDVAAVVERVGPDWQITLQRRPAGAPRLLRGHTCAEVVDAAVVLLALMADPSADEAPPPRPWSVGVWVGGELGSLPSVSPGLAVGASVGLVHGLHVELFVAGWLPRTRVLENEGGAAARVSLVTGTVGARYAFALLPFELGPALGVDLGWMGAQGYAVSNPGVGAAAWVAARAGGVAAVSVGVIRFSLRLEAAVPLVRPHFVLLGVGEVHTTGWVTARALLGVELAFPSRNDAVPAM